MPAISSSKDQFLSARSKTTFTRNATILGIVFFLLPFVFMAVFMVPGFISMALAPHGDQPAPPNLWFILGMGLFYLCFLLEPIALVWLMQSQMKQHRKPGGKLNGKKILYATLRQRALARMLDALITLTASLAATAVIAILFYAFGAFSERKGLAIGILILFLALFLISTNLYLIHLEGKTGLSPGRKWMRIRVLTTDLKPCGFLKSFLRSILMMADAFGQYLLGILFIGFSQHQQRVGDLAAGTVVVKWEGKKG